ncbi:uncharacterized protein LOC107857974 [Capsicum annuum]|uniref:uncharacterized protein LOC107857974 n=1 Tax=Capsicum annuum TaxID=4072 RepID=UPI001FB129B5|nr:uncharacterized protein LOC107857974 [Capsicum annuum]
MGSPWPFTAWGMDVIGPIEPPASNGHRFILVAIDYFTKWVDASTHKVITKKVVADFVRNNLVCWFGIPESIITDNGANIYSDLMREICKKFKISHRNSTAYRLQINGVVEAANKNIKRILMKIVDGNREWHENFPYALLGYRTTIRTSTGATLYMLVYESEAVIPTKVEIPLLKVIQEVGLDDSEWIHSRMEQLMLIDEKRLDAVCHGQLYQNRIIKVFNKKVKPRRFTPGQLVLKKIFPHQDKAKGSSDQIERIKAGQNGVYTLNAHHQQQTRMVSLFSEARVTSSSPLSLNNNNAPFFHPSHLRPFSTLLKMEPP